MVCFKKCFKFNLATEEGTCLFCVQGGTLHLDSTDSTEKISSRTKRKWEHNI